MKLTDLEARFLKIISDGVMQCEGVQLSDAQGVIFLCPKCFAANGGNINTHSVICWFRGRGVPDEMSPKPGRWTPEGTGIDDLTFIPGSPPIAISVLLTSGCGWHGYVTNGDAS